MGLIQHEDFTDTIPTGPVPFDASRHRPDPRPKWVQRTAIILIGLCVAIGVTVLALAFSR